MEEARDESAMKRTERFTLVYRGDDVVEGAMDLDELAPALLSLGELLKRANEIANGDRTKVKVRIQSDFRSGSFEVDFQFWQSLTSQLGDLLSGEQVLSPRQLLEAIGLFSGISGLSLFGLYRWLKGGRPDEVTEVSADEVEIVKIDKSTTVNNIVNNYYQDPTMRRAVSGVLKPVRDREGIDELEVREDDEVAESVTKDEAASFIEGFTDVPTDEPLYENVYEEDE